MTERESMNGLVRATAVGTALQLAMVLAGHWIPGIAAGFAMGGVTISLVAGVLFALWSRPAGRGPAAGGGALAGGACAAIGIAVSVMLGDVPVTLLLLGTLSSVVTGALGGLLGRVFVARPDAAV